MNNDAINFSEFTFQVLNQTGGLGHYSFRMVLKLAINQSQPMVIPHKNKTVPRHSTNYQLTLSFFLNFFTTPQATLSSFLFPFPKEILLISQNYPFTIPYSQPSPSGLKLGMPNNVFLKMVLLFNLKVVDQGYDEIHYILFSLDFIYR